MPVPLRPAVTGLPAYVAGRPAPSRPDLVTYKMSSNENPFPPLPGVLEAVALASASMNRYPDIANTLMADALGARLGVDPGRLAFGTGSVGVLYHLLQAVCGPGDEVVHAWRSFEAYPIAVLLTGARWVGVPLDDSPGHDAEHDLDAMLAAVGPATRAVLLCSPNNPTGPALRHDDVVAFVEAVPDDVLIVVDEAYVEFVTDPAAVRGLEVAQGRDNVVVLRTFSKAYGLAGFRVGYCVAEPRLAQAVRSVALPFGVSLPAQAAVLASLEHEPELLARVAELVVRRDALADGLRALGVPVPDAQGNFVWIPAGPRTLEVAATFGEAGLVVRPYASDHPGDGVRITVGEPEANARVLEVAARLDGPGPRTVSRPA
jgi:histidinol-phosphate aminotransferase